MEHLFSSVERENSERLLVDLFKAYRDARRHKRAKQTQLAFEFEHEKRLMVLHKSIIARRYAPLPSTAFMIHRPVMREVFAADFQDRVVHHLIYNQIAPVFEKCFIDDSYSCRKGKGTLCGVNRIFEFIDVCSDHYVNDTYILKLDIKGYFYAINRQILYDKVRSTLLRHRDSLKADFDTLDYLIRTTIFADATKNVHIVGSRREWGKLPHDKSLFHAAAGCGLPIGNLTSQLFSNIYLNGFDHHVTEDLDIQFYGRYVDDFVLVHQDKAYLLSLIPKLRVYLKEQLHLTLHPKKIYLQHFSKGVRFLGAYIKPHVKYIDRRTKTAFYHLVGQINRELSHRKEDSVYLDYVQSAVNSYLGLLSHFASFKLRRKILSGLDRLFWEYYMHDKHLSKVLLRYRG